MTDKSEYAKWLVSEIELYHTYHNHKETMAWAITGFYVPSIIMFGSYAGIKTAWLGDIILSLPILLVSYLVLTFANMQFSMRWEANDIIVGLMRAVGRLCNSSVVLSPVECEIRENEHWPVFVQNEIAQQRQLIPRLFWTAVSRFVRLRLNNLDDRWKTEIPSYGIIFIATIIALILIWVLPN